MSLLTIEDKLVVTVSGGQRKLSTNLRCCHECYACDCRNCDETPAIGVDFSLQANGVDVTSQNYFAPTFIYEEEIEPWEGYAVFGRPVPESEKKLLVLANYSVQCVTEAESINNLSVRGLANKYALRVQTRCGTATLYAQGEWTFPFLLCDRDTRCIPLAAPELWCPWGDDPPPPPPPGFSGLGCYPDSPGVNLVRYNQSVGTITQNGVTVKSPGAHYGPRAMELVASMVPVVQLIENPLP